MDKKFIHGEEFVDRVMDGERDFSGVEFPQCYDFSRLAYFRRYLEDNISQERPLVLNGVVMRYVRMNGLYLPFTQIRVADLYQSSFRGANLRCADLTGALTDFADFTGADLEGANLEGVSIDNTYLLGVVSDNPEIQNAAKEVSTKAIRERDEWRRFLLERCEKMPKALNFV